MLHRTQILLDTQTKRDLQYVSEATNQSMSKLVRKFVAEKVKIEKRKINKRKRGKMSGVEALLKMAEAAKKIDEKYGSDYPTDVAANVDHYLYGAPKRKVK